MSILFLYNNLFDSSTLVESSQNANFPAENTQHPFITKVWRTDGATPGTATLDIDLGSAQAVTCIALAGYNWTSQPGTFRLQFDNDPLYGSIDHTEDLTWYANPTVNGNKGVIIKTFASQSYQYLRLDVVYSPGGDHTDWDLGRVFIGTYFEPQYNYNFFDGQSGDFIDPSYVDTTIGGQDHIDVISKYRVVDFSFVITTQAQWELFQKMINTVGIGTDLFIAFDYDAEPDEMTIYGRFIGLPGMKKNFIFEADFAFKESR